MIEEAKITFFKVDKCGFYKSRSSTPDFGDLASTLANISTWGQGRDLGLTKTYEPDGDSELLPTYLLDIVQNRGDWVLALWNETPSNEAGVASVSASSPVGNAQVEITDLARGRIPGFATYFWFIPSRNIFATIRFQHLLAGQPAMQWYIKSFLTTQSKHAAKRSNAAGEIEVLGYRHRSNEPTRTDVEPRFKTSMYRKPGDTPYLIQHVTEIRKVVRKMTIRPNMPESRDFWQHMLRAANLSAPRHEPPRVKIKYELDASLSETQLKALIADWERSHDRTWDDYGFVLAGEAANPYWLSRSIARQPFDLDITRLNDETVDVQSLLSELLSHKNEILRILT